MKISIRLYVVDTKVHIVENKLLKIIFSVTVVIIVKTVYLPLIWILNILHEQNSTIHVKTIK